MKWYKWITQMGVLMTVALAAVVAAGTQSAFFGDSLVLPEPLPGSYADQQRAAYLNQTGITPGWEYFATSKRFGYVFTVPSAYYSNRFVFYPGVPRAVTYRSHPFPQLYGPYLPEIPASPKATEASWVAR